MIIGRKFFKLENKTSLYKIMLFLGDHTYEQFSEIIQNKNSNIYNVGRVFICVKPDYENKDHDEEIERIDNLEEENKYLKTLNKEIKDFIKISIDNVSPDKLSKLNKKELEKLFGVEFKKENKNKKYIERTYTFRGEESSLNNLEVLLSYISKCSDSGHNCTIELDVNGDHFTEVKVFDNENKFLNRETCSKWGAINRYSNVFDDSNTIVDNIFKNISNEKQKFEVYISL